MTLSMLPVLIALASQQDRPLAQSEPTFLPVQGASIDRSVDSTWEMSTTGFRLTMKQRSEAITTQSSPSLQASLVGHMRITDDYLNVSDGHVSRLKRVFREAKYSCHQEAPLDFNVPDLSYDGAASRFEGRAVVFDWNPDQQTYKCADLDPATAKADPTILRQEMDFEFALPHGAQNLDEWSIDIKNIGNLLFPGGDVFPVRSTTKRPPAGTSSGDVWFGPAWQNMPTWQLIASPTGVITASLKENQDSSTATQVKRIVLKVHVHCRADVSETMRRALVDAGIPEGRDYEYSQTSDLTLDGEGEIVWDLAKNRARSLGLNLHAAASDSARLNLMARNSKGVLVPTELNWSVDWGGPFTLEFKAGS